MGARTRGAASLLAAVKSRARNGWLLRGALRVLLSTWKAARLVPGLNRMRWTLAVDGLRMRVRVFSYDDLLTASPDYEPVVRAQLPPRGATAIDAGAFIGRHTLELARAVGPRGRVVAIEPHPENFALLETNVRLNGAPGITCVPVALGAADGLGLLRSERETSTAQLAAANDASGRGEPVCVRALDALLEELGIAHVDWIKLDVEGAELEVLTGAERLLTGPAPPRLLIEVHGSGPQGGDCARRLRQWLAARRFEIAEHFDGQRRLFSARIGVAPALGPQTGQTDISVEREVDQGILTED
ncbi:MAG: FkbM family methyltransferase [Pirellulales bacterium]|nr:FkbM family methyltransferase [Pirellulales bacterium]